MLRLVSQSHALYEYSTGLSQTPPILTTFPMTLSVGPVVGGVVDESMPRYCLLGEAVTISAELEQNGVG